MKNFTSLFFIFLFWTGYGQCDQNFGFSTQADVDNFPIQYPGCTTVRGLAIVGSDITNLNGLSQITTVIETVTVSSQINSITNDYMLTDISGLNNITHVGEYLDIYNLKNLSTTNIFQNLISAGTVRIFGLAPVVMSGFNNMLSAGNIEITSPHLVYFEGFSFLSTCNNITIDNCDKLQTIGGFVNLSTISNNYSVTRNPMLLALPNMPALISIGGTFQINYSDTLTDFEGLNALQSIGSSISLRYNGFESFKGLNNLTSVDYLTIDSNPKLMDLSHLSNLRSVNRSINITSNSSLTNLYGLDNIDPTSFDYVVLGGNPNLSNCAVSSFCERMKLDGNETAFYNVSNNGLNCNYPSEIRANCTVLNTAENLVSNFTIYPNPVKNKIYLENIKNISAVSIVDVIGRTSVGYSISDGIIDVSQLSNGVYFLIIDADGGKRQAKFIKE